MEVHGWRLFQHKLFKSQFDKLVREVEHLSQTQSENYASHRKTKLLARIVQLITTEIPADPGHERFNLGSTLGSGYRFWKRAKFGRYRLFFRYDASRKVIIYAWINDEQTLRKAGDKNDPYAIFARGLQRGQPPSSVDALLRESDELASGQAEISEE
jgi:toxin YhaV